MEINFTHPVYLWFLASLPLLVLTHIFTLKYVELGALNFANFEAIAKITKGKGKRFGMPYTGKLITKDFWLLIRRSLILIFLILAIAGTIISYTGYSQKNDFVIAFDNSQTMLGDDFEPTRLSVAKQTTINFIDKMPKGNEVGLITFSSTTFIHEMPTTQHSDIKKAVAEITISSASGTSIGDAIVSSVNLLLMTPRHKSIILVTDGHNNVGIPIDDALDYARSNEVSINTIGLATKKGAHLFDMELPSDLNEEELEYISAETGGVYFKAETKQDLEDIYNSIGTKTKTKIVIHLAPYLLLLSLLILFIEWGIINVKYKTIG